METKMQGVFGMYEMERAAEIIVNSINNTKNPKIPICLRLFSSDAEQTGFCELLARGWLDPGKYNGEFVATAVFIERVRKFIN